MADVRTVQVRRNGVGWEHRFGQGLWYPIPRSEHVSEPVAKGLAAALFVSKPLFATTEPEEEG